MEVIAIDTNDHVNSKSVLWAERIHSFQESGLSRKEWCRHNEIPQSTMSYWLRKFQSGATESERELDPVFAKLPSEQELHFRTADTVKPPVVICLPENIRVETAADCPARLIAAPAPGPKERCLIFSEVQRSIWPVAARICARATLAWRPSSN